MLLAEPEKYKDAIDAIKKDIAYELQSLRKNLKKKILPSNETLTNYAAGKLRLGYPESITPEEIPF